jgi:pyruvate,water dikinase
MPPRAVVGNAGEVDDPQRDCEEAHKVGAKVGLCGQARSDHPKFAEFLVDCGIDSISVSPDSFFVVKKRVAASEAAARAKWARQRGGG